MQKVSNLILNINLQLRDVATGKLVQAASTDIRGNTDESWEHGIRYLIKNSPVRAQVERRQRLRLIRGRP